MIASIGAARLIPVAGVLLGSTAAWCLLDPIGPDGGASSADDPPPC